MVQLGGYHVYTCTPPPSTLTVSTRHTPPQQRTATHHVRGLGKDAALQAGVAVRVQVVGLAGGHVLGVRPPVERRLDTEGLHAPQRE